MQRNNEKSSEESRKDERSSRRQSNQRGRNEEDYHRNRGGLSRFANQTTEDFDFFHQQQLQQQFQDFQLAEKRNIDSSRSTNRRMGAVLPTSTPSGSSQGRSVSVPPVRRINETLSPQYVESEEMPYEANVVEFQRSNYYPPDTSLRSPKKSVSRGNGAINNVNSDEDYYAEIDATTSTSTPMGK